MPKLIVALDVPTAAQALGLVQILQGQVDWFKVGLELYLNCGAGLVHQIRERGLHVFLDLKIYDIPRTAAAAAKACATMGAEMLTAHCQGGERMLRAMLEALHAHAPKAPMLVGVTALTSFAAGEMPGICRQPGIFALDLARLASTCGVQAVVCSPLEAGAMRQMGLLAICPGIRVASGDAGDQRRIATPRGAVAAGADFLVVGRPITQATDPQEAAAIVLKDMDIG